MEQNNRDVQRSIEQKAFEEARVARSHHQKIVAELEQTDPKALRGLVDDLKNQLGSGVVLLATAQANKVSLIAGVTKDLTKRVKAGDLVNQAANVVGGKGGGRPDMAQAGGSQPEHLSEALATATSWLEQTL